MIKIDMDMPISCAECPFEVYDGEEDYYFCSYTDAIVTQMRDSRHNSCPLKNVCKKYDCSCLMEYPNKKHKCKNGKWKCVDRYDFVEVSKHGYTHCRKKVKE